MDEDRSRIRFDKLEVRQLPDSRCAARVVLAWRPGDIFVGTADGLASEIGILQCAAKATTRALEVAVDNRVRLVLLGVTTIKAFDAVIVVVSLASRTSGHEQHLVGSAVVEDQPGQAAVRAVLNATNRLLGNNLIYLR